MSDIFDMIGDADVFGGGVYFEPGVYPKLWIEALKMIKTSTDGHDMFVAEIHILESNVPERPKGSEVSWVANLTKHKSAAGNVKQFLCDIAGLESVDDIDAAGARLAVSSDNPFNGTVVMASATNVKTRAGGDFTQVKFTRLDDDAQEAAIALHTELGFSAF